MNGILDRLLETSQFTPGTSEEFVALQLARRLDDEIAITRYVHYVGHYAIDHLLRLYETARHNDDPARAFHTSLSEPSP